jgi:hypothetical protein
MVFNTFIYLNLKACLGLKVRDNMAGAKLSVLLTKVPLI